MKKNIQKIGDEYKNQWKYFKEHRKICYPVITLFGAITILGLGYDRILIGIQEQIVSEIISMVTGKTMIGTIIMIIRQNLISNILAFLLGFTIIYPLIVLTTNSYLIGAITSRKIEELGFWVALRLLPHGIFEVPAFILAITAGLSVGLSVFKADKHPYRKEFISGLKFFLLVIIPLLIIAGIIEGILVFETGSTLTTIA